MNISNLNNILDYYGFAYKLSNPNYVLKLPMGHPQDDQNVALYASVVNGGIIGCRTGSSTRAEYTASYIIVKYTCTNR